MKFDAELINIEGTKIGTVQVSALSGVVVLNDSRVHLEPRVFRYCSSPNFVRVARFEEVASTWVSYDDIKDGPKGLATREQCR